MINCYRLENNGTIKQGIPTNGRGHVCVGRGNACRMVPLDADCVLSEEHDLLEARPLCGHLEARETWLGSLIFVWTLSLDFRASASSRFDISNAWPGLECLNPIFAQVGSRHERHQEQLVAIEDGETVFVGDHYQHYIAINCNAGQLAVTPAEKAMFARYLATRAEQLRTHAALKWTFHTLHRLGMGHYWTPVLTQRLRAAEQQPRKAS